MFDKILLPLDGSEVAEAALPYGEELARRLGVELILFHVCGPEHKQFCHMHQMYLDSTAEIVRREVAKGRAKGTQVKVNAEALSLGEPVETICDYVGKSDIGLMILAAKGASGFKLWRLGSVADRVCRTVAIPTMLIRVQDGQPVVRRRRISRILLPLDGSEAGELAIPVAQELALKLKARITLFQMAQKTSAAPFTGEDVGLYGSIDVNWAKLEALEQKRSLAYLLNVEGRLRAKGIPVTHSIVSGTDPGDAIIEAGQKAGGDLVVMSTRGRSAIRRWVFGSTAEKVLRHGELPLLLVSQAAA